MKAIALAAILALLVGLLGPAQAVTKDEIKIGEKYPAVIDFFGWVEEKDFDQAMKLYSDDQVAYKKFMLDGFMAGTIVMIKTGDILEVTENHVWWNGAIKYRPKGDYNEYWTGWVTVAEKS